MIMNNCQYIINFYLKNTYETDIYMHLKIHLLKNIYLTIS